MREYALDGVRTRELNILPDERGFSAEAVRQDWHEFVDEWIVQVNLKYSYPDRVTAWHRHHRGQVDYFLVIQGTMQICAYDHETRRLAEVIASQQKPILVRVPGHYWHGMKSLGNVPSLVFYFTNRLYVYDNPDEERRPWDDSAIIPLEVNGSKSDKRVNKPWDWFYPPHN